MILKFVRSKSGIANNQYPKTEWIRWFGQWMGWKDSRTARLAKVPRHKFKTTDPKVGFTVPADYDVLAEFVTYYGNWFSLREAEIWVGIKVFGWPVQRVADTLGLSPRSIRSTLQDRVAHFLLQSPEIAEVWTG